jgi:hypothetical protein
VDYLFRYINAGWIWKFSITPEDSKTCLGKLTLPEVVASKELVGHSLLISVWNTLAFGFL